jgi:hypothetical protein
MIKNKLDEAAIIKNFYSVLGKIDNGSKPLLKESEVDPNGKMIGFEGDTHQINQHSDIKWTTYLASAYAEGFCEGEGASAGEQVEAWAYLIATGACWKLQGFYGRTAENIINSGLISKEGEINWDKLDMMGESYKIDEKAESKSQQRFMGMVHAAQKGEEPASGKVAKVASEMKPGDVKDFASTKQKGLPEKVEEGKDTKKGKTCKHCGHVIYYSKPLKAWRCGPSCDKAEPKKEAMKEALSIKDSQPFTKKAKWGDFKKGKLTTESIIKENVFVDLVQQASNMLNDKTMIDIGGEMMAKGVALKAFLSAIGVPAAAAVVTYGKDLIKKGWTLAKLIAAGKTEKPTTAAPQEVPNDNVKPL